MDLARLRELGSEPAIQSLEHELASTKRRYGIIAPLQAVERRSTPLRFVDHLLTDVAERVLVSRCECPM
jgi:hypothetical protein